MKALRGILLVFVMVFNTIIALAYSDFTCVKFVKAEEHKSKSSRASASTSPTDKHVLALTFQARSGDDWLIGVGEGNDLVNTKIGVKKETGREMDGGLTVTEEQWPEYEEGPLATFLVASLSASGIVEIHLASDDVLQGGTLQVTVRREILVGQQQIPHITYESITYTVEKLFIGDASIDTRRGYSDPNDESEIGDPNSTYRYLNFGNYTYNGGLFVGGMPWHKDRSGVARIQLIIGNETQQNEHSRYSVLSMFYLGRPEGDRANAFITIGAYLPKANDSNLDVSESGMTWENRWDINPRVHDPESGDPPPPDYSQDPTSTRDFGSETDTEEYYNWSLLSDDNEFLQMSLRRVCLAIKDEGNWYNPYFGSWLYFASREYQSIRTDNQNDFPWTDCKPRVWHILDSDRSLWSEEENGGE
jgi:hypothetical protein